MLNDLYRINNKFSEIEKTIILYDLHKDEEEEEVALQNLQTCGKVLLNSKLKVKVEKEEGEDMYLYRYLASEEQDGNVEIKGEMFEIVSEGPNKELRNIWIY